VANWTRNRRFRPALAPTLAVAVLLPLLLSLGFWQLDRAGQKRVLQVEFAAGGETIIDPTAADLPQLPRYQQIVLHGRYQPGQQFLLDNMTDGGAAGYHVLTPFRPEGWDTSIIVNRGWVRKDFSRPDLPDVAVNDVQRELRGRLAPLPRPGILLTGTETTAAGWPRVVQFPDMQELAASLDQSLTARSLLLDTDAAEGYLRRWQPMELGPERHIGYAVQWFALATTLLIIYFFVNFKRIENDRQDGKNG